MSRTRPIRTLLLPSFLLLPFAQLAAMEAPVVALDPKQPYLHVKSDLLVGNKGEETFDVSLPGPDSNCGEQWVFDHAELDIERNRFGDVQIVALPEPGCRACSPGVVRWYHEPTGHLEFSVLVYRRKVERRCPEAMQQSGARPPDASRETRGQGQ